MHKNLWEIDSKFHCPLMGVCLTIPEQRRILSKARYKVKKMSDPQIHEILTSAIEEDSPLTRRVQKFFDNKYKNFLDKWDDLIDTEYLRTWRSALDSENIDGDLYGLVTRHNLPDREKELFTGSAHILAFYKWHQFKKHLRSETNLVNRFEVLEQKLKESRAKNSGLKAEMQQLSKELKKSNSDNKALLVQIENKKPQSETDFKLHQDNIDLRLRLENQALIIQRLKNEKEQINSQNNSLTSLLMQEKQANQILAKEITALPPDTEEEQCENCSNKALCKKRVLMVGGITKLHNFYRDVVEKFEGVFEYHDGYMRNGNDNLSELVRRADYVLCPVDVNSHRACLSVKRFCKKWDKPYHMLRNAGVSSVAMALTYIAQGACN